MKTQGRPESRNIEDRNNLSMEDIMFTPDKVSRNQFLLDTFKRARETGYPIHTLVPYLDQLPSDKLTKDKYDSVVIDDNTFVDVPSTRPGYPKFNSTADHVNHLEGTDHSKDQSQLDPWMFASNSIAVPYGGTRQSPASRTTDKTPKTDLEVPALDIIRQANDNKRVG